LGISNLLGDKIMDRKDSVPPQEASAGMGCAALGEYWQMAQLAASNFVKDYPLLAIITAVVFAIFGISQILPTIISTLLISVPMIAFSYLLIQSMIENRAEFSEKVAMSLAQGGAAALQAQVQGQIPMEQIQELLAQLQQQAGAMPQGLPAPRTPVRDRDGRSSVEGAADQRSPVRSPELDRMAQRFPNTFGRQQSFLALPPVKEEAEDVL
jgi:hypothetical protein